MISRHEGHSVSVKTQLWQQSCRTSVVFRDRLLIRLCQRFGKSAVDDCVYVDLAVQYVEFLHNLVGLLQTVGVYDRRTVKNGQFKGFLEGLVVHPLVFGEYLDSFLRVLPDQVPGLSQGLNEPLDRLWMRIDVFRLEPPSA